MLDDLEPFYREHHYGGDIDSAVEDNRVWMVCTCGATINRDADRD